jgi:hypothetical protein
VSVSDERAAREHEIRALCEAKEQQRAATQLLYAREILGSYCASPTPKLSEGSVHDVAQAAALELEHGLVLVRRVRAPVLCRESNPRKAGQSEVFVAIGTGTISTVRCWW